MDLYIQVFKCVLLATKEFMLYLVTLKILEYIIIYVFFPLELTKKQHRNIISRRIIIVKVIAKITNYDETHSGKILESLSNLQIYSSGFFWGKCSLI